MRKSFTLIGALAAAALSVPASATLPTPPMAAASAQAQAYLFHAGAGDVFEITTSMMAMQKSQDQSVRALAMMLIDNHTRTTNQALAAAKGARIMAPPPVLSPAQMAEIGQLSAASGPAFDRLYLQQQLPAHQQALQLHSAYAASGDAPALRQLAQGAVPVIRSHIARIEEMMGTPRR